METNKDKERMMKLIDSFEKKGEIFIDSKNKKTDENKISEEKERLKDLALKNSNDFFKEDYSNTGIYKSGQGKMVSSVAEDFYQNDTSQLKVSRVPLQAEEGLEIAIKRALKSGAPINNISFYDEVNWHLMSLGFPAKAPIDIKNSITGMLDK